MAGLARRLAGIVPSYAAIAWWGLVTPRGERAPLDVHQGVILGERGVLLAVRSTLRGWELPGGEALPGESGEEAVRREIFEETGIRVAVERPVADWVRTGFRPHTAHIYRCRVLEGEPRPSEETPLVRWFPLDALPDTLFPWFRTPLLHALSAPETREERHEHQGVGAILAGLSTDLRMRLSDDRAGCDDRTAAPE